MSIHLSADKRGACNRCQEDQPDDVCEEFQPQPKAPYTCADCDHPRRQHVKLCSTNAMALGSSMPPQPHIIAAVMAAFEQCKNVRILSLLKNFLILAPP